MNIPETIVYNYSSE